MISLLMAYDDNDMELGEYFEQSFTDISSKVTPHNNITLTSITGLGCTEANITHHISAYNGSRFVFVGLSHGNDEQLRTLNDVYVSNNISISFRDAFFYTSACSCCHTLGGQLITAGCLAVVGYDGKINVWEGYHDVFIECENSGLIEFLLNGLTIRDSVTRMLEVYDEAILSLSNGGMHDIIVAGILVDNKSKLTVLGDDSLTSNDFSL